MDGSCDTPKTVSFCRCFIKKRYVLCEMPADWTTLPVHSDPQSTPRRDSIAVYTKNRQDKYLVYEGFICPPTPEKVFMSALQMPPKQESFAKKYARLQEKIRAEEAEAEAQKKSSQKMNRAASSMQDSAASSQPEQGVVEAEPSTMPGCEDSADGSKQQINTEDTASSESKNKTEDLNLFLQRTESNTDYPLPLEILNRRESLLPVPPEGGMDEFIYGFEPWENTDLDFELLRFLYDEQDPFEQFSSPRRADTCHTPDLG